VTIVLVLVFIVLIIRMLFLFAIFSLLVALVPGMSQVIALRGSYNDGCRRQQFRWSLAETWSRLSRHRAVYMTIHIPCNKGEEDEVRTFWQEGYFAGYIVHQ
jgi:hypothetical protein